LQKAPAAKPLTHGEKIEEARAAAYIRVQVAYHRIQGVAGSGGPPGARGLSGEDIAAVEERQRATRLAQVLLDWPDPDMGKVETTVSSMLTALRPGGAVKEAEATDTHCNTLRPGYVLGNQPPIVLCPAFFGDSAEERIRTMIHESAHVSGIGQPKGESYCVEFDCEHPCGDANSADSWAHYVNCLSGQPADVPLTTTGGSKAKPSGGGAKSAPPRGN
jgi:hypothetical protein